MIKGFKDFLMRGNVIDLAVGIAIGVAFTSLVAAFGDNFINPIVASVGGGSEKGFGFQITDSSKTLVDVGALINALIVFAVTMAVIYFAVVVPVQKMQAMRRPGPGVDEPEAVPEDTALLREIRDALARRPGI
ncbi:large conductance mechanosensitive channel protein MscL [Aeromicrobium sp. A1-2]|uniref:large conductance mechanosensitive channel protein MscL n=1 Tax=Aeromicrobium sp. A1-2 TaxID=2107713 RepID=UPI000E4D4C90|nr:large conductance mechanosensitive channel protein MscL [Aeromicrobium sp. A1-2]AXT85915.1 large conductance mechanosensitive channel protein MscL [Aeromicrobium sp. A1-2]